MKNLSDKSILILKVILKYTDIVKSVVRMYTCIITRYTLLVILKV